MTLLFMSGMDIAMILGVALLLFGGKKLPELARGLGSGIKEFKDASSGVISPGVDNMPKSAVTTVEPTPVAPIVPTVAAETHG
ncbi:twin-arginine translocase TatA/TatE family subunit [Mucilaginibacter sp. AW1-3]